MGLLDFIRRRNERAIPEPGTPEFDAAVGGSAIPDSQSVSMGERGWTSTTQRLEMRDSEARAKVEGVLREHGIDPDREGQTIDAGTVPGLSEAILAALGASGVKIPDAGGFGGGVSAPEVDREALLEHLAAKRDSGEISEAEFEAQRRYLLQR